MLVEIGAVAVNPIDTYIRTGAINFDRPKPFIVGCDLAGTVEAVGPDAQRFKPGDRVWGSNQGLFGRQGTFADTPPWTRSGLSDAGQACSDEDAAAMALVGITAHLGLFRDAKIKAGETLFVNGGTGGVGSTVVQMAKAVGARVIDHVRARDEKCQAARAAGRRPGDQLQDRRRGGRGQGIRPAGRERLLGDAPRAEFRKDRRVARRARADDADGRPRARPTFPVGPFYVKGCSLHGFVMFMATADEQRVCADDINYWLATGRLRPKIDRVMKLSETAAAHRLQEEATVGKSGATAGKIVLTP